MADPFTVFIHESPANWVRIDAQNRLYSFALTAPARAFAIADNRLAETSTWNEDVLAGHLKALSPLDLEARRRSWPSG